MGNLWSFLKKLKIELSYDPAIPLLGIYLANAILLKRYMHPNVYRSTIYNSQDMEATQMPFDRGMDKGCYIYTMEYYSALNRMK